jgi:hypothetical protein
VFFFSRKSFEICSSQRGDAMYRIPYTVYLVVITIPGPA